MIKELLSIANELDRRGLLKEASALDMLLKKAIPIEGIFELPPTTYRYEDEDGEELGEPEWESGEVVSDPVVSGYKSEDWYGALSHLGARVILIPFEAESLDYDDVEALSRVFGTDAHTYEELKKETNSFSNYYETPSRIGSRDVLKSVFPSLWTKISKLLLEKGLSEDRAVYLLFNEDHPPPRGNFEPEKSPHYFSHDIGHIEVDFNENPDMASDLYSFLFDLSKFYKTEDDGEEYILKDQLADEYDDEYYDRDEIYNIISFVFKTFSGEPEDQAFDVISNAMAGSLEPKIPEEISYKDDAYFLLEDKREDAEALLKEFVKSYMKTISSTNAPGSPLEDWAGSVMLYDI